VLAVATTRKAALHIDVVDGMWSVRLRRVTAALDDDDDVGSGSPASFRNGVLARQSTTRFPRAARSMPRHRGRSGDVVVVEPRISDRTAHVIRFAGHGRGKDVWSFSDGWTEQTIAGRSRS
jgi:hypothetical protein